MSERAPDDALDGFGDERAGWTVRRIAAAIAASVRTMDPVVAQVWASPGVPPFSPGADAGETQV